MLSVVLGILIRNCLLRLNDSALLQLVRQVKYSFYYDICARDLARMMNMFEMRTGYPNDMHFFSTS